MANITGTGVPTRKTSGAIGDIYTDNKTGKRYKCSFAYRSDNNEDFDCEWKEIKNIQKTEIPVSDFHDESTVVEDEVKEVRVPAHNIEAVEKKPETMTTSPRKDYTSYGKKSK